jgi:hypothetical protein
MKFINLKVTSNLLFTHGDVKLNNHMQKARDLTVL